MATEPHPVAALDQLGAVARDFAGTVLRPYHHALEQAGIPAPTVHDLTRDFAERFWLDAYQPQHTDENCD